MEIEQIVGRLNYLKDNTAYSSIQVTITEGVAVARPFDKWGFETALNHAAHAFINTVNGLIILVGYLAPFAILAALGSVIWNNLRRRIATA